MNTITKILWAVLAGIVMLWVGGGTPAEAHHPVVVSADAACLQDGTWLITWTVRADATRQLTWWLTAPVNTSANPVPDTQTISFTTTAPGDAASASTSVSARWSNNATGTRTGRIELGEANCTTTTTTSTTSTSTSTSTTTSTTEATTTTTTEPQTTTTTEPEVTTTPPIVIVTTTVPETTTTEPEVTTTQPESTTTEPTTTTSIPIDACEELGGQAPSCDTTVQPTHPGPEPKLPDTGGDPWAVALVALLSLSLGGSALWAARR